MFYPLLIQSSFQNIKKTMCQTCSLPGLSWWVWSPGLQCSHTRLHQHGPGLTLGWLYSLASEPEIRLELESRTLNMEYLWTMIRSEYCIFFATVSNIGNWGLGLRLKNKRNIKSLIHFSKQGQICFILMICLMPIIHTYNTHLG